MTLQSLRRTGRTTRMVEAALRWGTTAHDSSLHEPIKTAHLVFSSRRQCWEVPFILQDLNPHIVLEVQERVFSQDDIQHIYIREFPLGELMAPITRAMGMSPHPLTEVVDVSESRRQCRIVLRAGLDWPEDSIFVDHHAYEWLLGSLLDGVHSYDPVDATTRISESEAAESLARYRASDFVVTFQDQREEAESTAPKQESAPESELVRSSVGIRALNILKPEGATDGG